VTSFNECQNAACALFQKGTQFPEQLTHCYGCGQPLIMGLIRQCVTCGKPMNPSWKFCGWCGANTVTGIQAILDTVSTDPA
jgi:hypothetical protein